MDTFAHLGTETPNSDINAEENDSTDETETSDSLDSSPKKTDAKPASTEDRVQKRINKLTAKSAEKESKIQQLEAELQAVKAQISQPKDQKKKYSNSELQSAIAKGFEDGNHEVVAAAVAEMISNEGDTRESKYTEARQKETEVTQKEKTLLGKIVNQFPEMQDPNSLLRKTAEQLYEVKYKVEGYQGMYDSTVEAYKILVEEGAIGNESLKTRVNKAEMKKSLSTGDVGPSDDQDDGEEPQTELDKYISQRNNYSQSGLDIKMTPTVR